MKSGAVERIDIFTTTMRTVDNKGIIIPNAKMTGDNIINYHVHIHQAATRTS